MAPIPTQVSFRGLAHTEFLDGSIHERVAWLERFHDGILGCRVLVELPHRHRHGGRHFHVRIEAIVRGRPPVVVNHEPSIHGPLKDLEEETHRKETEVEPLARYAHVAIHQAFDAARRQLQDLAREQTGRVKTHEEPDHGHVAEISAADGFGFIESGEQRVYFTRASVLGNAFDSLEVGTRVAYAAESGEKGPQASTVRVLGKHHYVTP